MTLPLAGDRRCEERRVKDERAMAGTGRPLQYQQVTCDATVPRWANLRHSATLATGSPGHPRGQDGVICAKNGVLGLVLKPNTP